MLLALLMALQVNAHVNLAYPIGGEVFNAGETVNIQWEIIISHDTENWDLYYTVDGGNSWVPIELDIPEDSLNYLWVVPDSPTSLGQIRIVMDNVGSDYDDMSEYFTIESVTAIDEVSFDSDLKVYPNPMTKNAYILFDNPNNEKHKLVFYNTEGRIMREMNDITTDRILFKRDNLAGGMYYFQLKTNNEIRAVGKLIIE
jgi:hypothetical protein